MDSENNPNQTGEIAEGASSTDGGETPEERRARMMAEIKAKAAAKMAAKGGAGAPAQTATPSAPIETPAAPPASTTATATADTTTGDASAAGDETPEQKRARIIAEAKAKAAAKMAAKGSASAGSDPSVATPIPTNPTEVPKVASTKEVPAGTPPAARVAPGAAKTSPAPVAGVAKGIPAAVAAKQHPTVVDTVPDPPINKMRRRIVWASIIGFLGTSLLMFFRFFLPRAIFEPSSIFRVGFPGDYGIGVDTKYQQLYRVWVVKTSDRLFVINAVCTHLGCTPDWKPSENKFKCPCHGSGYDSEGINFEGPAPRPMDRAHVELDAEGHIVVNKGKLYDWPKGGENKFDEPGAYIPL